MRFSSSTYGGMNDSEHFQSSRPGLEDMVEGRFDPLEAYTDLGESVISLYAETAKEIGVSFPFPDSSGDLNARAERLRALVRKAGVPLRETRAEKKMEEVYEALKTKVLPDRAKAWDAQDLLASNAILRRLRKEREGLVQMKKINAVILQVYGQLVGFIAKKAPPPFSTVLTKYEEWFSDLATKTIEEQLAAVTAEIPKAEKRHKQILAARVERRVAARDAERKRKKQKEETSEQATWWAYGTGAVVGLALVVWFTRRSRRGTT